MPRETSLLHPPRTPAVARPAATVLLVRDSAQGLQVLMTRRSDKASFAPGAFVFPGGGLDPQDHDAAVHAACIRRADQHGASLVDALAAVRESFEELGILMARHADGRWADGSDARRVERTPHDANAFYRQFRAGADGHTPSGLRLAVDGVRVLSRWITDRDMSRRFDVAFLVARIPEGQLPVADEQEQFEPVWIHPQEALQRHAEGHFFMIFPTIRTLEQLRPFSTADDLLAACERQGGPFFTSCPRGAWLNGREIRVMEHEPAFGELALVCPDGQIVHALDWQTERPVALLRGLQRLTCGNPGVMTGPGTNSYIVGEPGHGHVVIDPGPVDAGHAERLWQAAAGDIRAIVCTHSHPDHSPGAGPLQALCEARSGRRPAVLGLSSAATARPASAFVPDRELADGERLALTGSAGPHTLQVIHTPGHAANHLCLLLLEDGILFSGDHVLNGSTTVIDPPDGDMTHYLESLDRLALACRQHDVLFIAPAHGHVMGGPEDGAVVAIEALKAHRLRREARILEAMQALPAGTPDDWLRRAYADVPERLWPVAMRSLMAHVKRLQKV